MLQGRIAKNYFLSARERFRSDVLLTMEPFPLKDTRVISLAVSILLRFLDKGRYKYTLQFEKARKIRLEISNMSHSFTYTLSTSVIARMMKTIHITYCPTYYL